MSSRSNFRQIFRLARPYYGRIFIVSFLILLLSILNQFSPQINRFLVDLVTENKQPVFLGISFTFAGLLFLLLIFRLITTLINRLSWSLSTRLQVRLRHHLRELAYDKLLHSTVTYYNRQQSGKLMSKIQRGTDQVSNIIRNFGMQFLPSLITAVISIIIVIRERWEIGLAALAMFIPFTILRLFRFKSFEILDKKGQKIWDNEYGHFYEAISNIRLIKSFASLSHELKLFRHTARKIIKNRDAIDDVENKYIFTELIIDLFTWGIYAYIFFLGLRHVITIGTVFLLIQYTEMIKQPLWNISWIFWEIKMAKVGAEDYLKILNHKDIESTSLSQPLPETITGHVRFQQVSFTYPERGGSHVLERFNLEIKPGSTLAVVGRSGAGKTTLAHLLIRFFDPTSGDIFIDNTNVKNLDLNYLRRNVGLVMQQSYLFDDTIIANLRYGKPNATLKEMKQACHIANADEFINKLQKKYHTRIGERGVKLSGGQQQRLSIARTILKNPPILILDEATSALDSHSERLVQGALWELIKGRTTIIIAHRLSTIQKANQIIVLGKKKVLEQGTHQQLLEKDGIYASLHRIQSGQVEKLKKWDLV